METNLRPLTLGEILDRTAYLYRSNFLLFAGIFSLYSGVSLVFGLAQIGIGAWMRSAHMLRYLQLVIFSIAGVEMLLIFLLLGAAVAAISRAVAWVNLGEPVTVRGAYASIMPRLGRYLWLMTITAFVVYTPLGLLYGGYFGVLAYYTKGFAQHAGAAAAPPDPAPAMLIGVASIIFVLLLIPAAAYAIFMTLRYALAVPACVVENLKARSALRRSVELSKGARGRMFVLLLLIVVIKVGLVMVTQVFFLIAVFKHRGQVSPIVQAISQIVAFFTNTFLGPIGATGITLFYYDQRVRNEGYDIEWMMQAAGLTPAAPQAAPPELAAIAQSEPVAAEPPAAIDPPAEHATAANPPATEPHKPDSHAADLPPDPGEHA